MKELKIPSTKNSPEIAMTPDGAIKMRGRSIHENSLDFFKPVMEWLNEYLKDPVDVTCVDINLEYFNSTSSKILISILQKISYVQLRNKKFIINWYYEDGDEDILERGEYFSSVLHLPFNFTKIN